MEPENHVEVRGCGGFGCLVFILALAILFNVGGITTAIAQWIGGR